MENIKVCCPAKINLTLDIIGKDLKGYHFMEMIMQSISLFDYVYIRNNNTKSINIYCDNVNLCCDENNIAYKVAKEFFKYTNIKNGIDIKIEKNIPMQAGLAGGSADGAGVLVGLNKLFRSNLSNRQLCDIGFKVGADIPFCISGGTTLTQGFGEKITPIDNLKNCYFVIIKPNFGISTKKAFQNYDKLNCSVKVKTNEMIEYIKNKDIKNISKNLENIFEYISGYEKDINFTKKLLIENGSIGALMSGSGSAVFGIFDNLELAQKCYKKLLGKYNVFLCQPVSYGAKIL